MKPFNLKRMLAGDLVITRNKQSVTQLVVFKNVECTFPIYGVLDDSIEQWTLEGKYNEREHDDSLDLFMAPIIKTYWINILRNRLNGSDQLFAEMSMYDSEIEAKSSHNFNRDQYEIVATKSIEIEE